MEPQMNMDPPVPPTAHYRWIFGVVLITLGVVVFIDRFLQTGWLYLLIFPAGGLIFLMAGVLTRKPGLLIPGSLLTGLGLGSFFALSTFLTLTVPMKIGMVLTGLAAGWFVITLFTFLIHLPIAWWATIPGTIIGAVGLCFLLTPMRLLDFALYLSVALAIVFLAWGIGARLIGLIIPGGILAGIGPGVYMAWSSPSDSNALTLTGIMLAYFALGWGLITLVSRLALQKLIWWPLIPGGVLAVTGWGLYIGGNPGNALSFIGNTGSLGLILLGVYLLLWRQGLKK